MYFEKCRTLRTFRDEIVEFQTNREAFLKRYGYVRPPSWALADMRGRLDFGPPENPADTIRETVYADACIRANAFYAEDDRLPPPPVAATDADLGLRQIIQWTIEGERAQASGNSHPGIKQAQEGDTQRETLDRLPGRIRAYVREGSHRQELRGSLEYARKERPDILKWLEPYRNRLLKDPGIYEDEMPSPSLGEKDARLLNRLLVVIGYDAWTGPDEAKIAYDWYSPNFVRPRRRPRKSQTGPGRLNFDDQARMVGAALRGSENRLLEGRVARALDELEAEEAARQTETQKGPEFFRISCAHARAKDAAVPATLDAREGVEGEPAMSRQDFLQGIADEVEKLITDPSDGETARAAFNDHLRRFKLYWEKYWQAKRNQPEPYSDADGNNGRPRYEYDADAQLWEPIDPPALPPDPMKWEISDKLVCHYATLAVVHDQKNGEDTAYPLCAGILDPNICIPLFEDHIQQYDPSRLQTALRCVNAHLGQRQQGEPPAGSRPQTQPEMYEGRGNEVGKGRRKRSKTSAKHRSISDSRHRISVNTSSTIELPKRCKPLTSKYLGEIFGCSARTILRRIKDGTLDAEKHGRKYRVRLDQLPAEYVQKVIQK